MTRDIAKLRLYRITLIDRRKKYLAAHKSVGAIDRELVHTTMRIIKIEMREQTKIQKVAA